MLIKYHFCLSNRTPIHGSAPNLLANSFSSLTSSLVKYLLLSLLDLHSMANFLILFPARTSGQGYFIEPDPATLTADQFSVPQNRCISSLSAFIPFDFRLIFFKLIFRVKYFMLSNAELSIKYVVGYCLVYNMVFGFLSSQKQNFFIDFIHKAE